MTTREILVAAKKARSEIACATAEQKNYALELMACGLVEAKDEILIANKADIEKASGKISDVMLDRLSLNEKRIFAMADGIRQVAKLPDPVGRIIKKTVRPNGLIINKISVPIGVVAIIYESRPNVTSDAAALAVKSGNVCILRGGKEAFNSSDAICNAMRRGLVKAGFSADAVLLIQDTTRESAIELMKANGFVDLLIPRGGAGLINSCVQNATVPCIQTGTGICHIYVDEYANQDMALEIIENAKTSRPSVCNAQEVCLVNKAVANEFLPKLKTRLVDKRIRKNETPVELICDEKAYEILKDYENENIRTARTGDFDTEFLDYKLAVGIVDDVRAAANHISEHSTGHSEAIITDNRQNADIFVRFVDSAAVYVNASTRFTDGGEFGLGCEMGISTQKMHARGPMGLEELNTYKYVITGNGQIR